jgi:hypothetical protein
MIWLPVTNRITTQGIGIAENGLDGVAIFLAAMWHPSTFIAEGLKEGYEPGCP